MSRCVSCALIPNKNFLVSPIQIPIHNAVKVRGNNRTCGLRVQLSMVDSSSADFTRRIERAWLISKVQSLSLSLLHPSNTVFLDILLISAFNQIAIGTLSPIFIYRYILFLLMLWGFPFSYIYFPFQKFEYHMRSFYFKCSNYVN